METMSLNMDYEDNPDFNQWIDEQHGNMYYVLGVGFQPSKILFEMEPETYRLAVLDYKQQELADFKDFIQNGFPSPIAYHFHRFEHGFDNYNNRLEILRDVWEALIRLLFAIVVGEFICSNYSMVGTEIRRAQLFSDRLYDKLTVIKKLIQFASEAGLQLSSLSIITTDVVLRLEELNRVRNVFSHMSALPEDQARQMAEDNTDDVVSLLKELKKLSEVIIMRCVGYSSPYIIRTERFMGYAINRRITELTIKPEQMTSCVRYLNDKKILAMIGEHIFCVSPFLHFVRTEHNTNLCFYMQKEGTSPNRKFIYEMIGGLSRPEIGEVNFTEELGTLDLLLPDTSHPVRAQGTRGIQL